MGKVYIINSGYTTNAAGCTNASWDRSDAYLHASSTKHIGLYRFGRSSASTTGSSTGNYSIAQAAGITLPATVVDIRAINWTTAVLHVQARDNLANKGTYTVYLSTNYARTGTQVDANIAGVVAQQSVTWNAYGSSGHKTCSILNIFNGTTSIHIMQLKTFYIMIRNTSLTAQLRFNRINNWSNACIDVTGTIRPISGQAPTVTNNWGTSQTITPRFDSTYNLWAGTYAMSIDSGAYGSSTSATTISSGTLAFGAHTVALRPNYTSGCSDSTGSKTTSTVQTATFYIYGNKPSGTISVNSKTATSVTVNYSFTANNATLSDGKIICYGANSTVIATHATPNQTSGTVTFTGLAVNTTYTFKLYNDATATAASGHSLSYNDELQAQVNETTLNYTACGAPTSVTIQYVGDGKLRVSWSGATGGTNNAINGYDVSYMSTKTPPASPVAVSSTAASGYYDFSPGTTNAYYGVVRTKGAAGASYYSGWAYSSSTAACPMASHPTVSVGEVITKSKMDTLRSWKAKGTAVTVGNTITKTIGDTYATTPAVGNTIQASWYNNA